MYLQSFYIFHVQGSEFSPNVHLSRIKESEAAATASKHNLLKIKLFPWHKQPNGPVSDPITSKTTPLRFRRDTCLCFAVFGEKK